MAFPYTVTMQGLADTIRQLRVSFPDPVTAETLKKWGLAPNNESTVLVVLRFLNIIDEQGKRNSVAAQVFFNHNEEAFATAFADLVQQAYSELFTHFGDDAWTVSRDKLISFFRVSDQSSSRVGTQQARTFQTLANLAGHGKHTKAKELSSRPKRVVSRNTSSPASIESTRPKQPENVVPEERFRSSTPALTVRIEINLPISDDQEVYNKIFKSIRENLINE